MITGLILLNRNSSFPVATFSIEEEAAALVLRVEAAEALRPRLAYFPYPSWPVPAAGPFLFSRVAISGAVFVLLPKSPKRDFVVGDGFEILGLGVRVPALDSGCWRGRKSGMIPNPETGGAGVASLGECKIGDGEGLFRGFDGIRLPSDGRCWEESCGEGLGIGKELCLLFWVWVWGRVERLLCTTFIIPICACKSGVPSLLGRLGGPALTGLATCIVLAGEESDGGIIRAGFAGDEDEDVIITGLAGTAEGFEGEASISSLSKDFDFLNFWLDFLGGGLGGIGDNLFFFFFSFSFSFPFPSPLTVEFELEEVTLSLKLGKPCVSSSAAGILAVLFLVTIGGRLRFRAGEAWRSRGVVMVVLLGAMIPGDWEEMDVGVVSLL
jgi:hypothetical protein